MGHPLRVHHWLRLVKILTFNWRGTNTTNDPNSGNWNVTSNWREHTVPKSDERLSLQFKSGLSNYTSTNDLTDLELNSIYVEEGDGASIINVDGNLVKFVGTNPEIRSNAPTYDFNFDCPIESDILTIVANWFNTISNFNLTPGNNNINVNEIIIEGGTVGLRQTQNNIGKITIKDESILFPGGSGFSTTAPVYFDGNNSVLVRNARDSMTIGGMISNNIGAGRLRQWNTAGSNQCNIIVPEGEDYLFSGDIATGGPPFHVGNNRIRFYKGGLGTQRLSGFQGAGQTWQTVVNNGLLWYLDSAIMQSTSNYSEVQINGHMRMDGVVQDGSGEFIVNGLLSGSGEIRRPTLLNNTGTIKPIETFTINYITTTALICQSNSIMEFELGVDLLDVTGDIDLKTNISITNDILTNGTYKIIGYSGSLINEEISVFYNNSGKLVTTDTTTLNEVNLVVEDIPLEYTARYWRIFIIDRTSISSNLNYRLRRFRLYDATNNLVTPDNMTDNTTPVPYVASSSFSSSAFQAFDGDINTSADGSSSRAWIKIDLGENKAVASGDILWNSASGRNPGIYVVQGSVDDVNWVSVFGFEGSSGVTFNIGDV